MISGAIKKVQIVLLNEEVGLIDLVRLENRLRFVGTDIHRATDDSIETSSTLISGKSISILIEGERIASRINRRTPS